MKSREFRLGNGFIVEYSLALIVLGFLIYDLWWVWEYGYLPQPFFYEPADAFMDWFNTAYWSRDSGAYDSWITIYPPLSFVALRLIGLDKCYTGESGQEVRDCDWVGLVAIHVIFILNLLLLARTYVKIDKKTALARSFALGAGMPMLYAVERGNILLLCFTCVILGFGPLLKSAKLRWLFAGLAINFKVYLVGILAAHLLRRRWLWFEGATVAIALVYLFTYTIYGAGSPSEIYSNITYYSSGFMATQVIDIWYSVTYLPLISLLEGQSFPATAIIGSKTVEIGLLILPLLMKTGQLAIVFAALAAWLRPEVVPMHRLAFLAVTLALISSEASGYTLIIVIFFVFMERWEGILRPMAIILSYILCIPNDIIIGYLPPLVMDSYFSGGRVEVNYGVGLGMFVRPALLIFIGIALSAETINRVHQDVRQNGSSNRWRYRRDWPILPNFLLPGYKKAKNDSGTRETD
jgi:hypothetical protein